MNFQIQLPSTFLRLTPRATLPLQESEFVADSVLPGSRSFHLAAKDHTPG